jgi:nucleosome binding factor SPN SPT16 subunit
LEKLQNFTIVSQHLNDDSQGKYLLLKMNFKQKVIEIVRYAEAKFEQANDDYLKMEEDNNGNQAVEVVLVSIQDVKKLSQSYPNYFMDTTEFINNLKLLFQILDMQNDAYYPKDEIIKQESERIFKEIFIKMTGKE